MNLEGAPPSSKNDGKAADALPSGLSGESRAQQEYCGRVQLHQANPSNSRRLQLSAASGRGADNEPQTLHQAKQDKKNNARRGEGQTYAISGLSNSLEAIPDAAHHPRQGIVAGDKQDRLNQPQGLGRIDLKSNRHDSPTDKQVLSGGNYTMPKRDGLTLLSQSSRHERAIPSGHFRTATPIGNPLNPGVLNSGVLNSGLPHPMATHLLHRSAHTPADSTPAADGKEFSDAVTQAGSERQTSGPDGQEKFTSSATKPRPTRPAAATNHKEAKDQEVFAMLSPVAAIEQQQRPTIIGSLIWAFDRFLFLSRLKTTGNKHPEVLSSAEGRPLNADIYPVRPVTHRRRCRRPGGCVLKAGDGSFCDRCVTAEW